MKNISSKIILLVLAVLVVLATVYFLLEDKAKVEQEVDNQPKQEENQVQEQDQSKIQARIEYTTKNIAELSPVDPVLGGSWMVTRFWFRDENNFYVEYEDGHILRQILISYKDNEYKVVGYFEPGENMFELKEGEDTIFGEDVTLYEYSQDTQVWERQN